MVLQILIFLISTVILACRTSSKVNYYVKFFIFLTCTLISGTIFVPFMLHRPRDSKNGLLPSWGLRVCARLMGITYEVRGKENIVPEGQGCVVLVNHQSVLDLVVMSYLWPLTPRGRTISKKEVLYLFPFGPATWFWGTVFIDRLSGAKAQQTINKTGEYITSDQARICMFPEGTRNEDSTLLPFKKGAFHIALSAQCPIQPVVCSQYHFLDSKEHRFDSGHNIIEFLPAIPTKGLTKDKLPQLMEKTRDIMQDGFTRVTQENNHKKIHN